MIDRDTIIRMAREAGGLPDPMVFIGAYERFAARVAALAAAAEREACAQLVAKRGLIGTSELAEAIRARSNP